jgi:hypothetical protein
MRPPEGPAGASDPVAAEGMLRLGSGGRWEDRPFSRFQDLGSGLIDYSQKMTTAAMQIADMNV